MTNLNDDQRGLVEYLADRVRELVATARDAGVTQIPVLIAEAEELTAIRTSILARHHGLDAITQLQLPLEIKKAA